MSTFVILPDQLFLTSYAIEILKNAANILIIEDPKYFVGMCKSKVVLHKASCKYYRDKLRELGFETRYISVKKFIINGNFIDNFLDFLVMDGIDTLVNMFYVASCHQYNFAQYKFGGLPVRFYENPNFLLTMKYINSHFITNKSYNQTAFYKKMREIFAKWIGDRIYDSENQHNAREFHSENPEIHPPVELDDDNSYYRKAMHSRLPKELKILARSGVSRYPINHGEAREMLRGFIENRLKLFGKYQDVVIRDEPILFHSVLSSSLNIGLLTPLEILDAIRQAKAPMNSIEGFVRQIIGWREFSRALYTVNPKYLDKNYFGLTRQLPAALYTGTTGFAPVDYCVKKVMRCGYLHHIERLMIMGNFCLLQQIAPREVLRWFTEVSIDSYDWVMIPNVIGMSQFADGGMMGSRPYFSSSRYLLKMTDFENGAWAERWDALFYKFVADHSAKLLKTYRSSNWVKLWKEKPKKDKARIMELASKSLVE